jgi:hypothetical protein
MKVLATPITGGRKIMSVVRKSRFTYANVTSTLALVIAIGGGGAAVAATVLPANSVGSAQIKSSAVINSKLANRSVTNSKLGNASVNAGKLANGSVTTGKFASGTIGVVRGYAWNDTASPTLNTPANLTNGYVFNSSGGTVSLTRTATGSYYVDFAGLNLQPATVLVSAYGSGNPVNCHETSWGSTGNVGVACYDSTGAPVDSRFTIAVIR